MTPADAPNASDGPLAATKPPEDLTAEPIGNTSRTRRVRHRHNANPARIRLSLLAPQSLTLRPTRKPQLTITGAIRSP
jgi:hypothetical protein